MVYVPKKVEERIKKNLPKFKRILKRASDKEIKETDTVIIVTDMIEEIFGYDKYVDITAEQVIQGKYCDLAIKKGDDIHFIIEVKAISLELKISHLNQALDYAVNAGVDWAILTNGVEWDVYNVIFKKPIAKRHMFKINLLKSNPRDHKVIENLYMLCKESLKQDELDEFRERKVATNKYLVSALIQDEIIIKDIRRELRKIYKGTKIEIDVLHDVIINDVLKRDVLDPDKLKDAERKINNARRRAKESKK